MSLRWRFTLIATVLLAAVLVAGGLLIGNLERERAYEEIKTEMSHLAHEHFPGREDLPRPERGPDGWGWTPAGDIPLDDAASGVVASGARLQIHYYMRFFDKMVPAAVAYTGEQQIEGLSPEAPQQGAGPETALETVEHEGRTYFRCVRFVLRPKRNDEPRVEPPPRTDPREAEEPGGRRPGDLASPRPEGRDGRPGGRRRPRRMPSLHAVVYLDQQAALQPLSDRLAQLRLTGFGALAIGGLLAFLLSGFMVRPITRAAKAAEGISTLEQRLPDAKSRDELGRLVAVLNSMLGRLQDGAERERGFLATASHELRRPLAALTAELELAVKRERSPEELQKAIGLSLADARGMGRLVDDLLDHARARAGALHIEQGDLDIVEWVTESVSRSERVVGNGVSIEVAELPDARVKGDRHALGRVLENLLVNAATHGMPNARVRVSGDFVENDVVLYVEDDGPGIPPDDLRVIFETFARGDQARSRPGAGLGLPIARDLVVAHGGSLEVDSPITDGPSMPHGTRFTVRLPAERTSSPNDVDEDA